MEIYLGICLVFFFACKGSKGLLCQIIRADTEEINMLRRLLTHHEQPQIDVSIIIPGIRNFVTESFFFPSDRLRFG